MICARFLLIVLLLSWIVILGTYAHCHHMTSSWTASLISFKPLVYRIPSINFSEQSAPFRGRLAKPRCPKAQSLGTCNISAIERRFKVSVRERWRTDWWWWVRTDLHMAGSLCLRGSVQSSSTFEATKSFEHSVKSPNDPHRYRRLACCFPLQVSEKR